MSADFKQAGRIGRLTTELGKDVLTLMRFEGQDHMNDLFEYRVTAISSDDNIDFDKLIGTHATVELATIQDGDRVFDGIVTEARWDGDNPFGFQYELVLRPWFWLAGKRRNQRIFHDMSVIEIIEKVLSPYSGLSSPALKVQVSGSYQPLEYTVQYRESDLAFLTRLMERFGISYHFAHDIGSHTLTLSDDSFDLAPLPGESRTYDPVVKANAGALEHFWQWRAERRLTTGAMRLMDFNFKSPSATMEVTRPGDAKYAQGEIESYDYPGDYLDEADGKVVVATRLKEERGRDKRHRAQGNVMSLSSGMTVALKDHPVGDDDGNVFVCISAQHSFFEESYSSADGASNPKGPYSGSYTLVPQSVAMAPERKTPMARVQGPQTATVVGEGEIDCDEFGRIVVMFHWDLEGAKSMRCRVSQSWAGKGWGGMVIPRIGMEVVVEFLEGDPDKPIVTGCVYNGKNDVPYPLPANKTRSTFKTDSHQAEGFNELRFEDKGGEEEVFFHAQKDRNEVTLHCHTEQIGVDWSQAVGNNKSIQVGKDHTEAIGQHMTQQVAVNKTTVVGANSTLNVGTNHAQTVGVAMAITVGAASVLNVGADSVTTVGGSTTTTVGDDDTTSVGSNAALVVGENHSVEVGKDATENVGKKKIIEVGDELVIKVGKASIQLKKDGTINIKGKTINWQASGKINGKAGGDIAFKGAKIKNN